MAATVAVAATSTAAGHAMQSTAHDNAVVQPPPASALIPVSQEAAAVAGSIATSTTQPSAASTSASSSNVPLDSSVSASSSVWDPSSRGWLIPTDAQREASILMPDTETQRQQALAINRQANDALTTLHPPRPGAVPLVSIQPRPPARVLDEDAYLATMESIIRRDFFPALDVMQGKYSVPPTGGRSTRRSGARKAMGTAAATAASASAAASAAGDATPLTPLPASSSLTPITTQPNRREGDAGIGGSFEEETPQLDRPTSPIRLDRALEQHGRSDATAAAAAPPSSSSALIPAVSASSSSPPATADASSKLLPSDLRLGSFLELHTSEDNASFHALQQKRQRVLEEKYFWANAEREREVNERRLVVRDGADSVRDGNLDSWRWEAKNRLFFYPDHRGRSEKEIDPHDTMEEQLTHALAKKSRSIEYENTRFPGPLFNPLPGVNRSSRDRGGEESKSRIGSHEVSDDGDGRVLTPAIGGYKLVRTPSPMPGGSNGLESPMMTWGQILATPAHLAEEDEEREPGALELNASSAASASASSSSSSSRRSGFHIAARAKREELAWGMVEQARRKQVAERKRKRMDATPVPLGHSTPTHAAVNAHGTERSALPPPSPSIAGGGRTPIPVLSPAAQRLMAKTLAAAHSTAATRVRSSSSTPSSHASHARSLPSRTARGSVDMQLRASYSPSPAQLHHGRSSSASRRPTPAVPPFHDSLPTPSPLQTGLLR